MPRTKLSDEANQINKRRTGETHKARFFLKSATNNPEQMVSSIERSSPILDDERLIEFEAKLIEQEHRAWTRCHSPGG